MERKNWYEVLLNGSLFEHVSEFKCLRCVLDDSGTDGGECHRKVANGRNLRVLSYLWLMLGVSK